MSKLWEKQDLLVLIMALFCIWLMPYIINTFTLTILLIYAMLGFSLGLIWGFGGILCFGQAAFFGLGAYTYAISAINIGESTMPMLLAVAIPAIFAALLGAMMFYSRLSDVYLAVITLVVTLIFFKFMNSTAGPQYVIGKARLGGFNGIPGFHTLNIPGRPDEFIWGNALYYVCAIALLIVFFFITWLLRTSFGRIAIGIRENETRVALMGYDVRARKTALFAIGAGIAGFAGALFANWSEIVTPGLFSLGQSAEIIIWCIVGGLGTRFGPIIGAAGLAYLKFLLGQQTLIENTIIMGIILVVFVLFFPRGIVPAVTDFYKSVFTRKLSRRNPRYRHRKMMEKNIG